MKFSDIHKSVALSWILIVSILMITSPIYAQGTGELEDIPRAPSPEKVEKRTTYNPQGARDPFRSLLEGVDKDIRPPGLAGLQISELSLQGIQIGLGKVAIVTAPDGMAYAMKLNDSVFDGKLVQIKNNKAVFEKIIYDAFGREKEKQKIELYLHRK